MYFILDVDILKSCLVYFFKTVLKNEKFGLHTKTNTQYEHAPLRRKQLKSTLVSSSDCLGCILHIQLIIVFLVFIVLRQICQFMKTLDGYIVNIDVGLMYFDIGLGCCPLTMNRSQEIYLKLITTDVGIIFAGSFVLYIV